MRNKLVKAGAALTLGIAAFSAASAQSQVQNQAGVKQTVATSSVTALHMNKSGLLMPPLPAPGTWPVLLSGLGMIGFANRRRVLAA